MLRIAGLYKKYDSVLVLNNLDMEVHKGDMYGLIGDSGAGKTVTIKIIAGISDPSGGEIWIGGVRGDKDRRILKRKTGYVPGFFGIYENLRVDEYLEFYASAYGIYGRERKRKTEYVLDFVELSNMENRFVDELSRGAQQRLGIARALLHEPELLVIDEAAAGLDPASGRKVKNILKRVCGEGGTVLMSSHVFSDISDICTRIGIIHKGNMIMEGNIDDIICSIDSANPILITVYKGIEQALEVLKNNPLVERISIEREKLSVIFSGSREEEAVLLNNMVENGAYITSFKREYSNLESVFYDLAQTETGGI